LSRRLEGNVGAADRLEGHPHLGARLSQSAVEASALLCLECLPLVTQAVAVAAVEEGGREHELGRPTGERGRERRGILVEGRDNGGKGRKEVGVGVARDAVREVELLTLCRDVRTVGRGIAQRAVDRSRYVERRFLRRVDGRVHADRDT